MLTCFHFYKNTYILTTVKLIFFTLISVTYYLQLISRLTSKLKLTFQTFPPYIVRDPSALQRLLSKRIILRIQDSLWPRAIVLYLKSEVTMIFPETTTNEFFNQKKQTLSATDLSKKGSIDVHIRELVNFINDDEECFTTSSCSGRTVVYYKEEGERNRKSGCRWLYTSHDAVQLDDLLGLDLRRGETTLKFEPAILHVRCRTTCVAKSLLTCALESGFKNSGLTIGRHGKISLAVRSCLSLEVPLSRHGILFVTEEYLSFLVAVLNEKLEENRASTARLFENVREARR